jgi:hypothetical protein
VKGIERHIAVCHAVISYGEFVAVFTHNGNNSMRGEEIIKAIEQQVAVDIAVQSAAFSVRIDFAVIVQVVRRFDCV